ncbi:glycosyltransferase family 4 protein [Pedobacter rhizosphaerae]|uniref:Glycosyltransferase involved in cell wall bisynthesis n=1 Tax=Pedobacter rhizosphaerae TaxID=390241 RepID=A0A1H9Q7P6_9SPHI|nr:glycosyltransferase family 1 protein [Pedobacter rhizosphaerae]SER56175.1 Glycosyltransferase involved in cell wall bisynthesis [Pedobacter rhizosphaerae]
MKAESIDHTDKVESTELEKSSSMLSAFSFKIGFDGKRAANNLTGLGNYSRFLIGQVATRFPENEYFIYTPKVKSARQIDSFLENDQLKLKLPITGGFLWRSFGILKDMAMDGIQLYHGLSHEIPFAIQHTTIKSVVTIHDLIFLRFPRYYKLIDRKFYHIKSKAACKNADKIIAISEKTKQDIISYFGTDPDKIEVIYQSCDDSFKTAFEAERLSKIRHRYKLPEQYILNVGTIEERKNLKLLVTALKNVPTDYKLVVIGKPTPYYKTVEKEIEQLNLKDRIIFLKNIPFADLPGIYQMAKLFVYPSFYEGFGIPVIEALYSQVPVIAATGSCLEEAGGPNSLYVHPEDAEELSIAINDVLSSPAKQKEMKAKGLEFVQKFNSPLVTDQLMNCYLQLLKPIA